MIIIVGLKFGVFTPTEAGVVAAVYSLFVSMVIYRELPPAKLFQVFVAAAKITSIVMFLVACCGRFGLADHGCRRARRPRRPGRAADGQPDAPAR